MWTSLVIAASILAIRLLCFSHLPQLIQIQKTKNVKGINLSFWYILDVSLTCFVALAAGSYFNTGSWVLLASQLLNLILAVTITVMVILYKK